MDGRDVGVTAMTFGSLFAGIGGLDLGLERAGFECRWQVEIDPFAREVLERHWPGVKRYGDITKLSGRELEPVDLIGGGFPCQDLSQAGKRAGIEGSRSGLWFEYARLIGELRPRYVLIENVPGLLVYDAMRRVLGELSRLGYDAVWRSLRASEFGASHLRKRVFIVAHSNRGQGNVPGGEVAGWEYSDTSRHGGVLAHSPCGGFGELRQSPRSDGLTDGSNTELADCERARCDGSAGKGLRVDGPSLLTTRPGSDGGSMAFAPGPSDPRWPAILRERPDLAPALESPIRGMASRNPRGLDGSGVSWLDAAMANRTKRLGRLGNSVVPQCARWIGERIIEAHTRPDSL